MLLDLLRTFDRIHSPIAPMIIVPTRSVNPVSFRRNGLGEGLGLGAKANNLSIIDYLSH